MSVEFYRLVHLSGLILTFAGLAGSWGVYASGGKPKGSIRAWVGVGHGLGLTLLLISGFGMLAKLGYLANLPLWAIGKVVIWISLGGAIALLKRRLPWALPACVLLGIAAAYLCVYKP